MNNVPREKRITFLKGLLKGTRTINELIAKQEVFFLTYSCQPGIYYRIGAQDSDSRNGLQPLQGKKRENPISREVVEDFIRNPKFNVHIITIIIENEIQGQETESTFP